MKKRPMVLIFTGVLSGMAVVWNILSMATAFYLLAGLCIMVCMICFDKGYGWIIAGMILGIIFAASAKISMNLDFSQVRYNETQDIIGKVVEVSQTKTGKQALLLKNDMLEGKILLYTSNDEEISSGDVVSFRGSLKVFDGATNPGQFSNRHYYFSRGIYYHAYSKDILIKKSTELCLDQMIARCRKYLKQQLSMQYDEGISNFLNAMMLGDKTKLNDTVKDDFKESGLIHLMAVSGLHISLAGRSIYRLFRRLCGSFMISSVIGTMSAVFYCALTGFSVSSLIALIMLLIYFLSQILGEHYDLLSSASFAGVILLLIRPYRIYDTAFLYSFTAVFVIGCYQRIKPRLKGKFQKIRESLLFCTAIQIGMFPIIIYFQYEAPLLSFLANVIAVPLASTAFTVAFVLIFLPHTIFHDIISWMIYVILWLSKRSYGMLTIGHVPFFWVILFYSLLLLCTSKRNKLQFKIRIGLVYTGIVLLIFIPKFRKKTITFLDVGQGDCFIADTNAGLIISDGGSSSEDQVGKYRILPYIKYLGYQRVKIAVISHMDVDHYSGILELLKMGRIEYLGLPEIQKDAAMEKIIEAARQNNTKVFYLSRGRTIKTKDDYLKVLHPVKNSKMEKNAASIVMQGNVLGYKLLLTGDVEKEGEEQLLGEGLSHAEILKVAHHGSKNSTSSEFLQKVLPEQTIISCGQNNRYGHPHKETIHRLKSCHTKIKRTDTNGAVIFREKRDG